MPNSHAATRVHLSVLQPQDAMIGGNVTPQLFFGVSVCGAPYFGNGGEAPPISTNTPNTVELQPYLPWEWLWLDQATDQTPGFRWTLLVEMRRIAAPHDLIWRPARPAMVNIYAKPTAWNDDLDGSDGTAGSIRETWWRKELKDLTIDPTSGGWRVENGVTLVHASQLDVFYPGAPASDTVIVVNDTDNDPAAHNKQRDILGSRVLRWGTENPPYNFVNRLSAILTTGLGADLKTAMETEYSDFEFPGANPRIAAVPLWFAATETRPLFQVVDERNNILIIEQTNVPRDGRDTGAAVYPRRAYGNICPLTVPANPTVSHLRAGRSFTVEEEPWRKDADRRVGQCVDAAMLAFEWASTRADSADVPGQFINSSSLATWIVTLSADLFQARRPFAANPGNPSDAADWLRRLEDAAGGLPDERQRQVRNAIQQVLPNFPEVLSRKYRALDNTQAAIDAATKAAQSAKDALAAPWPILTKLEALANAPGPLQAKAQQALASLPPMPAPERIFLLNLVNDGPPGALTSAASDLDFLRALRTQIIAADTATPATPASPSTPALPPFLQNDLGIAPGWAALGSAPEALQRIAALAPIDRETRIASLRGLLQALRHPETFARLRAAVESNGSPGEIVQSPDKDWVTEALALSLDLPVDGIAQTNDGPVAAATMRQSILPGLKEPTFPVPPALPVPAAVTVQPVLAALKNYFTQRADPLSHLNQRVFPKYPAPFPGLAEVATELEGFLSQESRPGKARTFQNIIFGDRSRPIGRPQSLYLAEDEKVLPPASATSTGAYDAPPSNELDELAGLLILGQVSATGDLAHAPWMSLTAGCLRLRGKPAVATDPPVIFSQPNPAPVLHAALRGAYLNGRWSVSAEYDNRPLAAVSPQRQLVISDKNQLNAVLAKDEPDRIGPMVELSWPSPSANSPKLPGLRNYGAAGQYRFCGVHLSNSCALPPGFWTAHPAILDLASVGQLSDAALSSTPGVVLSDAKSYMRRVGITPVHLELAQAYNPGNNLLTVPDGAWPLLPPGVFPLAMQLPHAAALQDPGQPVDNPNPQAPPLVVLYPAAGTFGGVPFSGDAPVAHSVNVNVIKPATGDDNWERWVSADPDPTGAVFRARVKVCAEAHKERDTIAPATGQAYAPTRWQPADPAVRNDFLIVFRSVYPTGATVARAFLRSWLVSINGAFYGDAVSYFATPYGLTLVPDPTVTQAQMVSASAAHSSTFLLAPGMVLEMEIHALVATRESDRFLPALIRLDATTGECSLGRTVEKVLTGVTLDPDSAGLNGLPAATTLAVSPSSLRLETALLTIPTPEQAYAKLSVLPQGGQVSLGVFQDRDPEIFDFVHQMIVQEQIWRWNGKPVLPQDFPANGGTEISLPTPRSFNSASDSHFAWDGIGFHAREDNEHFAKVTTLPLAKQLNPDGSRSKDVDVLYTDDKTADARALYFRFSAIMRSRYFGVWPGAAQAGETKGTTGRGKQARVSPYWKRCTLPHRLGTPLKKPSVVIVIPLLASGQPNPLAGDTAGLLAIVREAAFEQGGLAERLECQLVQSNEYEHDPLTSLVKKTGQSFFQAGYDPTLSTAALASHREADALPSPVRVSGPVGLTFDQGSRDPLIVNSLYYIDVQRKDLTPIVSAGPSVGEAPAAHLFAQVRFRRTLSWDYEATTAAPPNPQPTHPLASEWTESQWIKFLPDSDLLRPSDGSGLWRVAVQGANLSLGNWIAPTPWAGLSTATFRRDAFVYLLCITRHDLDALGRPAVRFHSLYKVQWDPTAGVTQLLRISLAPGEDAISTATLAALPTLRGRVIEALRFGQSEIKPSEDWYTDFMPPPRAGVTKAAGPISEDAKFQVQSLSAAFSLVFS